MRCRAIRPLHTVRILMYMSARVYMPMHRRVHMHAERGKLPPSVILWKPPPRYRPSTYKRGQAGESRRKPSLESRDCPHAKPFEQQNIPDGSGRNYEAKHLATEACGDPFSDCLPCLPSVPATAPRNRIYPEHARAREQKWTVNKL